MVDERKVDALTDTSAALAQRAEILVRATDRSNKKMTRIYAVVLVAVAVLIWIGLTNRSTNVRNSEILNDVDRLVEFVDKIEADQTNGPSPETRAVFQDIADIKQAICSHPDFTCPNHQEGGS